VLPGLPPGWVVGGIWMVLFAAMGVARWLLLRRGVERGAGLAAAGVALLGFLCLLYPLYTIGLSNDRAGLVGNVITLLVALAVAVLSWRLSRAAGACIVAACLWLTYAGAVTANGLARGLTR
jgi:tryptophan-rich sensory protein